MSPRISVAHHLPPGTPFENLPVGASELVDRSNLAVWVTIIENNAQRCLKSGWGFASCGTFSSGKQSRELLGYENSTALLTNDPSFTQELLDSFNNRITV
ncbi:hypothetical protein D3C73_562230 [compost metagenome]